MTDFIFFDKIAEMIQKEQVTRFLYKKGICVTGDFTPYMSLREYTNAEFLKNPEKKTKVTVRFAKTFGNEGESDTNRDVIAIFVRFATDEGNFDLLCHNVWNEKIFQNTDNIMTVLDIAKKRNSLFGDEEIWKIISETPELIPFILEYFKDKCTVKSYRNIEGYSMNNYIFTNEHNENNKISFKISPVSGLKCISRQEAEFFAGFDKDVAMRELCEAIERKKYPEYYLELILENQESIVCGKIVLNNIADQQLEERIAFTPTNLVEGIKLVSNSLNQVTSFAFNESARKRGGIR